MSLSKRLKISLILLASSAVVHCGGESGGKRGVLNTPDLPVAKPTEGAEADEAERLEGIKRDSGEASPEAPAGSYALFARCSGWPNGVGTGGIEFYWNATDPEDRVILVRTSGSDNPAIEQFYAVITSVTDEDASGSSFLIEQKADSSKNIKGFVFELKTGTDLNTTFVFGSGESSELLCSTLDEERA